MMSSQPHQPDVVSSTDGAEKVDQSPPEKLIDSEDQYISLDDVSAKPEKPIDGQNQCLSWNEEDEFNTEGLRVLAVDDSLVCLKVLLALLHHCKYNVTETTNPVEALQILRMRKHEFDIVFTDLRMLEMDGLVLLQKISLEMDLPVVMLSADDSLENIMKAIRYGARDYIIKPPRMAQIKNVWQHVVRKRLFGSGFMDAAAVNKNNSSGVTIEEETDQSPRPVVESKRKLAEIQGNGEEGASTWNGGNGEESNTAAKKKRRVNWTVELHNKFIDAIEKIGPNAVPMEILKVMNVPWLTRANVASHLQKFKNALRGQAQSAPQGRNGYSNSAAGQNGYSKGMMNYGSLSIGASPQRFSYQQNNPNPRILPISTNLHQSRLLSQNQHYSHPLNYQAPTMLNNAPLPPRNVLKNMQSHPPLPRFNGLRFSALGTISNNMLNSYSFSEPYPAYPSAAAAGAADANAQQKDALAGGQNYVGLAIESQNTYPQLDWTSAPDLQDSLMISRDDKSSNFDIVSFEDTEMETWSMNNNCTAPFETNNNCEVKTFHSTPQEEMHIDASFEPINTNLSDEDEFNNMVNSFNFEGPPSLQV